MRNSNSVELIGFYGDDLTIACSAWTSTSRELTPEKKSRVGNLINMLWSEGHHSPFEKGSIHFLVDCDIASHIHLLKHRMSSLNAESARYKELKEDKKYIPKDWSGARVLSLKGGDPNMTWDHLLEIYTDIGNAYYHACLKDLEPLLGRKRAKESARFFKTYNSQIQSDVMFNMRSFANFQKLRNSDSAQKEIKEIAQKMLDCVKNIEGEPFKHTLESWEKDESFKSIDFTNK
jgi:flavin-dependent thymidylate synthase